MTNPPERTNIYRFTSDDNEIAVGYVGPDLGIYRLRWGEGHLIGRVDQAGRIFRKTTHDERELGLCRPDGRVRSHGLFEGGELGWVDANGVVVQAGLILGEEEVGRVVGPQAVAAGAALLLLFLPDESEKHQ
jgi:hypothetical protein